MLITVDKGLCSRDGACLSCCPNTLITLDGEGYPTDAPGAYDACILCGQCVAVCATGALSTTRMGKADFQEVDALRKECDPVSFAMRTRRSVRSFLPGPVPKADLRALFDVVRFAPSSNNSQKLWWIATTDRSQTKPLADLARTWMRRTYWPDKPDAQWLEDDDPILHGAPHLALCCGPEGLKSVGTDAIIALTQLDLLASSRGMGTCWAGVFLRALEQWPPLQEALSLPMGQKVYGGLFFGMPKHAFVLVPPRKPSAVDWR